MCKTPGTNPCVQDIRYKPLCAIYQVQTLVCKTPGTNPCKAVEDYSWEVKREGRGKIKGHEAVMKGKVHGLHTGETMNP